MKIQSNAFNSDWMQGFVVGCLMILVSASVCSAEQPPNFVLILADDLGYGDVSFNRKRLDLPSDIQTPNLDGLAASGMTFTQMRANCTVCSPTRAALLTGVYADRAGVPGVIRSNPASSWGYLSPKFPTLAARLNEVGYHTAIVGKWHLGLDEASHPRRRGFDFFHGFLGDMMDDYYTHLRVGDNLMRRDLEIIDPEGHATELFTQWSRDYLTSRSRNPDQPFFLYLPYNAPHFPIQPPEEWLEKIQKREPRLDEARAKNVAFVEHLDHCVGQVLHTLDGLGLADNTIVALTSDNGGSLRHAQNNDPWRDGKQSHYDGGLKVPFCVRYPGKVPAGSQSDYQGLVFDLHATFLDFAEQSIPETLDAVSLKPILLGETMPESPARELYFVRREGNNKYVGQAYHAIIKDGWKLMHNDPFSPLELYRLSNDPEEKNNLIGKAPKQANDLKRRMADHIQRGGKTAWQK